MEYSSRTTAVKQIVSLFIMPALSLLSFVCLGCTSGGEERTAVRSPASQEQQVPSLAGLYESYFPIGAAVSVQTLHTQEKLLSAQVNSLTAENAMKWSLIHPRPGNDPDAYAFSRADEIVAFAGKRGMTVRGHTLVWHQQVPDWVFAGSDGRPGTATKAEVLARLSDHIVTLLDHFQGRVYCWDVVNEALSDGFTTWRTDSPWHQIAGSDEDGDGLPDYIVKAFELARAADPSVKLFYNDYNIESGIKLEKAFELAKALKAKGLIDGIGIQGHWSLYNPEAEDVRQAIDRFCSLGLEVQITELDMSAFRWGDGSSLEQFPSELAERQAVRYGELFRVFRELASSAKFSGVTFWGMADDYTWLDNFPVKGRKDWPLLFDTNHMPKKAFWAVARW
jgi:endo-1,4-beta-xylanase